MAGQNYPCLLRDTLNGNFELHYLLLSGWTMKDLSDNLLDNVLALKPDLVVVHLGIIESTQRILSNWEKRFFSILPFGNRITGLLHRNRSAVLRIRRVLGLQARQVSLHAYSSTVNNIVDQLEQHQIQYLFIQTPTIPDNGKAVGHLFINDDAKAYNAILNKYEVVAIENGAAGWTQEDYQDGTVHFSQAGHKKMAVLLSAEIISRLRYVAYKSDIE